ncbi:substrate-binding domain-containing protein [Streptomyces sp. NPDC051287]|uniref:substrate-binding domain-containing protein n=1 Tax=Streptomyces sp. NPDC051287 TaxID=3365648 RepID=UPI0037B2BCDD
MRLTSVAIPAQEMGRHAVERLVAKLDGHGGDDVVLIAPELTVRASTGPGLASAPGTDRPRTPTGRTMYLPAGARWTDAWTGEPYEGGVAVTVDAPLERIPLFLRDGAELPVAEQPLPAAGAPR